MLANPTREVRIDQFTDLAHAGAAKECAGIGNLADRAAVRLREQLRDGSGTTGTEDTGAALSHTNLRGIVRLRDDVVRQIAQVEEPSTHGVEFHIDQFTRFNHDFPPHGLL